MAPTNNPTERTNLLNDPTNATPSHSYHLPNSFSSRNDPSATLNAFKQNDLHNEPPSIVQSVRALLFGNWINLLLVAVPLSFLSNYLKWGASYNFIISFIAIVPLASLLGEATEQCALKLGQTVGGLLNATFGNAVEAIVGILALKNGELRIVQTSMLGSILSNILLVLGMAFFAAGLNTQESSFQTTAASTSSSLLILSTAGLIIPAAYHASRLESLGSVGVDDTVGLLALSRGTALVLLICYGAYLYFQLKSHAYLFEDENEHEEEVATMEIKTAVASLVGITVITSFCADILVEAIDEFALQFDLSKAFIGLILLPIVGNAAEHATSVVMACRGKMEITIGVAVGSSIQISLGVIPLLVVAGWAIDQPLSLFFGVFETICLFVAVLLVHLIVQDGKSNYLEGLMLVSLYFIVALSFFLS